MNPSTVDRIANAVLYEGYILYPYRASSRKNRQRFTFGRVYPQAYAVAQNGAEPSAMQTECLVRSRGVRCQLWQSGCAFSTRRRGQSVCFRLRCRELPADIERVRFRSFLNCASTTSFIRRGKKRSNGRSGRLLNLWMALTTGHCRSLFTF